MTLKDYLITNNQKPVPWAKRHGLSEATIWRASKGKTFPTLATMRAIEKATKGAVRPFDWYGA